MNLRHIEIFHAVYTNGSVSAAARALNVAQPSVTKVLRHAEQMLGFSLFERTKGRLIPTEDAHALFKDVADIQQRIYSLDKVAENIRFGRGGSLRIASLPSLGLRAIPLAVSRFLKTHNGTAFDLQSGYHVEMVRRLYERDADLVITYEPLADAPVAHQRLGEGELVVFFREKDFPNAPPRIPLSMLANRPFIRLIRPGDGGPLGRLLSNELARSGIDLQEIGSARTLYMATALVCAGTGVTIVDNFTAHAAVLPGFAYRPIQPALTFDVHAIYLQTRPPSQLMSAFLKDLASVLETI